MIKLNNIKIIGGIVLLLAVLIIGAGCSDKSTSNLSGRALGIKINAAQMGPGAAEQLELFVLTITGPGITTPIIRELFLIEGFLVGEVIVPSGLDRLFTLEAFDADGRLIYAGETVTDISIDGEMIVNISLYPQVQMVKVSPRSLLIPQGSYFGLDLKVYNIPGLNAISVIVSYNTDLLFAGGAELNPALGNIARLQYLDISGFGFIVQATNEIDTLVDDSGYATLATLYFQSYSYPEDVVIDDIGIGNLELYGYPAIIPTDSVVIDTSHVMMYRPSFSTVAFWSMDDDTTNNIVFDGSGNNLDGTATGTYLETGIHGMARVFNGFSDYVEVPDDDLLDLNEELTISMYARINADQTECILISKRIPEGEINYQVRVRQSMVSDQDILTFEFGTPPGNIYQTSAILMDNEYHHLALSFVYGDPSSALWMIDGQVMPGVWATGNGTGIPGTNSEPLQMGRQLADGANYFYMGALDEVSISNAALDSIMIELLRRSYMPIGQ